MFWFTSKLKSWSRYSKLPDGLPPTGWKPTAEQASKQGSGILRQGLDNRGESDEEKGQRCFCLGHYRMVKYKTLWKNPKSYPVHCCLKHEVLLPLQIIIITGWFKLRVKLIHCILWVYCVWVTICVWCMASHMSMYVVCVYMRHFVPIKILITSWHQVEKKIHSLAI